EEDVLSALEFAHGEWQKILDAQEELRKKTGSVPKREFTPAVIDSAFRSEIEGFLAPKVKAAFQIRQKLDRYGAFDAALKEAASQFIEPIEDKEEKADKSKLLGKIFEDMKYREA